MSCATGTADVDRQLRVYCAQLERHYKDMQDTEFTVEEGHLFMLQTRNAKRPDASGRAVRGRRGVRGSAEHRAEALATIDADSARRAAASVVRPRRIVRRDRARCGRLAWRRQGGDRFHRR